MMILSFVVVIYDRQNRERTFAKRRAINHTVVLGLTAIPGLIKIAQGIGNEDVRERNGGISLMVIGGALFAATFAIEALF